MGFMPRVFCDAEAGVTCPGICWYPHKRTGHAVNQGGTADSVIVLNLFVLDGKYISVRGFFISKNAPHGNGTMFLKEVRTNDSDPPMAPFAPYIPLNESTQRPHERLFYDLIWRKIP